MVNKVIGQRTANQIILPTELVGIVGRWDILNVTAHIQKVQEMHQEETIREVTVHWGEIITSVIPPVEFHSDQIIHQEDQIILIGEENQVTHLRAVYHRIPKMVTMYVAICDEHVYTREDVNS